MIGRSKLKLDNIQRQAISSLIAEIETKTEAEVAPFITYCSDKYEQVNFRWLLIFIGIFVLDHFFVFIPLNPYMTVGIFSAFFLMVIKFDLTKKLMLRREEMNIEVGEKASQIFMDLGIHRLSKRNGILVFASIFEHKLIIIADESVKKYLNHADFSDLANYFSESMKSKKFADSYLDLISELGKKLISKYPRTTEKNEGDGLSNNVNVD